MRDLATPDLQEDNARTRETRWRFPPGGETGFHRHEFDYVVVPLTTGTLKIIDPNGGESLSALTAGVSYFREAGIEHNVINDSDAEFVFVEIELK